MLLDLVHLVIVKLVCIFAVQLLMEEPLAGQR